MAAPTNSVEYVVRRYVLVIAAVVFVLLLILTGFLLIKPRSHKLFKEATQAANHGDWKNAASKAAAAANLDTKQMQATRLAVLAALRANEHPLPVLSDRLFTQSQNYYDRYLAMRSDISAKRWEPFHNKVSTISREERRSDPVVELEAIALAEQGKVAEAIDIVRKAYNERTSQKMAFVLAELLFQTKPRPDAEIASLLAQVARPNGGADALTAVSLMRRLPPDVIQNAPIRPGLPALVEELPNSTTEDFLMAIDVERDRNPEKMETWVGLVVNRYNTHPSPGILRWLIAAGETTIAASAYDASPLAQQVPEYDDIRVALALDRKDYVTARHVLLNSQIYDSTQKSILLAVLATEGKMEDAPQLWERALTEAQKDQTGKSAQWVASAAKLANRNVIFARALAMAVETPTGEKISREEALEALAELVHHRDMKTAQHLVSAFFKRHPDEPDFENNNVYLRLLSGTPQPDAVEKLQALCDRYPDQQGFRSTLALAFLRVGKPQEALDALRGGASSHAARTIEAAALHAMGREPEAQSIAEKIDRTSLLPEEEKLLNGL